jgi:hypothetical protein
MITIGDFAFPPKATVARVQVTEAKSKVRKEIHIQSMIDGSLEEMRRAVEAFDRGETMLSLNAGRFYGGRRRSLRVTPIASSSLNWVDFWILTHDRYERSSILHTHTLNSFIGQADFSLHNLGNWAAPLYFSIQPSMEISHLEITVAGRVFVVDEKISNSAELIVDSENHLTSINGGNCCAYTNDNYPFLDAGAHSISIQVQPSEASASGFVQYRDYWI